MTDARPAIQVRGLLKRFGATAAIDDVSFTIEQNTICGLLGRNGAGKTTLMQMLTGQEFPTAGAIDVLGGNPLENAHVLQNISFIKESQRYPDDFKPAHVLRSAPWFFENWDAALAERLVDDFQLPLNRKIKKLSRGQVSAVGVIVGLASRAPLTFFDEPYLGLDAVARQIFYDRLLDDYAEHPRTVILSTHLIDEVADLLEHVLVIDRGRIIIDQPADVLRTSAITLVGSREAVEPFIAGREVLVSHALGGTVSATVVGLSTEDRRLAAASGVELRPVSLQQLVVGTTNGATNTIGAHA